MPDIAQLNTAHPRIRQVFSYLRDLASLRFPTSRRTDAYSWTLSLSSLPRHPSVSVAVVTSSGNGDGLPGEPEIPHPQGSVPPGDQDGLLTIKRPILTGPPAPPPSLSDWILPGWETIPGKVEVRKSSNVTGKDGKTQIVSFEADPDRVAAFNRWKAKRSEWEGNERPAREAMALFERFFDLHGTLQREGEKYELVLGDGILNWGLPDGGIHHPVLFQRVQLEFDPAVPSFIVREADTPPELYTALLRFLPGVDGTAINDAQKELITSSYHPLEKEATDGFLTRLVTRLSPKGEFAGSSPVVGEKPYPRIYRSPILLMRARALGYNNAIDAILEDIKSKECLPDSLTKIVGIEGRVPLATEEDDGSGSCISNEDRDVLFSKQANPEQLQIARRLRDHGCVLVQGPPGTGKTHTIANLLGHLMAQGKTILVTSHTTKALRRVREQVVENLKPLCVSVLESDMESRQELESSVMAMSDRFTSGSAEDYERRALETSRRRSDLIDKLEAARTRLKDVCFSEYQDIVVSGVAYPPSDAARKVASETGAHDWIPGPVNLAAQFPLTAGEMVELYASNTAISPEDENELFSALPDPGDLYSPSDFDRLVEELVSLKEVDRAHREESWQKGPDSQDPDALCVLLEKVFKAISILEDGSGWHLSVIRAGWHGGPHREPWESLNEKVTTVFDEAANVQELLLQHGPSLSPNADLHDQKRILTEILDHIDRGGSIGWLAQMVRPSWKGLIEEARVDGRSPTDRAHFEALHALGCLRLSRKELEGRWLRQMESIGGPSWPKEDQHPERFLNQHVRTIREALEWHSTVWTSLVEEAESHGFPLLDFVEKMPPDPSPCGDLLRIREAVNTHLEMIFRSRIMAIRFNRASDGIGRLTRILEGAGGDNAGSKIVRHLRDAVSTLDIVSYRQAFERLVDLNGKRQILSKRKDLLGKIELNAPAWAASVRGRVSPHGGAIAPGDGPASWLWRQLADELDARSKDSIEDIQKDIARLADELRQVTAELIEERAWGAQIRRTLLPQRQSLMGWLQTIRRIGRGTGKRAPRLQAEARRLMGESRSAVPVWIMPLSRVVENFDPRTAQFDVLVIDEASQLDVMGLIALYMAKQVVIVGDHEQVSPEAVGQKIEEVQALIDAHLQGIPNAQLYDGQMSVYDLAMNSFGGLISLKEHFRCVPEIIQFSNLLSYNGQIRPLRDASHSSLSPPVVSYRIQGAKADDKVNEKEAETVAALLIEATKKPEYAGKTFGVISMVGEEQARKINEVLIRQLPPDEYKARRILCGNAAHFQGDERDVMFLSMVDAPKDGPLPIRESGPRDMYKKRFNVAASRARDQMWVVYSLDPKTDLKDKDLRRRLIEHALDPSAAMRDLETREAKTESEFERQVLRQLVTAGFEVIPQYRVGACRIDMVVHSHGKKVAVECDGDRYHTLNNLEDDLARQAILERLGWVFVRIRGSRYFRNPEKTMSEVQGQIASILTAC